ncbi:ATPase AAA [Natrialba asiatica DSM 12278]|uniref:ATPase AAA n=2 Tax=Halobacteriales TaxID=2235 RepID=M0AFM9_NATA1|nr:ATPase AAA [Natrialba asiatica DSM 12278]
MAGTSPIYRGNLHSIGQVGSLVRIPQGLVDLVATVNKVSITESVTDSEMTAAQIDDERGLRVELIGQIDRGTEQFQRGVGSYPGLNDPVHFTTSSDLKSIFPLSDGERFRAGCLSVDEDIPVTLNAEQLVVQHAAIVGSTGSGKTSAVSSLLQNFVKEGWNASNIIVIDPHGEYATALEDIASVLSVFADGDAQLRVPYWALPAEEILEIFVGGQPNKTFQNRFEELITEARGDFAKEAEWLDIDPTAVSSETPIPFDIRSIWHKIDAENRETRQVTDDPETACQTDPGDAGDLEPAQYEPYGPAGQPPNKGPKYNHYGNSPEHLRLGLLDPQLRFFQRPLGDPTGEDPLVEVTKGWLGGEKPISVLDFSGVPNQTADIAIGVVLDLLFELALRSDADGRGIGRPSPVLVVLEEAHRYLSDSADGLTRDAANRIAREGRKYGVGLLAVTQRPKELPATALAQCGTLISLRLTNSEDQGTIKAALPDTVTGIADVLPSLRTHEAIISGEAVELPVRAFLDKPNPWPEAEDPSLEPWRSNPEAPDVEDVLTSWRDIYQ